MLNKGCYRIYIVLAISCGQAKTIRIRHEWTRLFFLEKGEKNLQIFQICRDTCGRGLSWHLRVKQIYI